jgi:hypothetical protein
VAALLEIAADHQHRAEQHEQGEQDVLEQDDHDHAEQQRADGRGDAEAGLGDLTGLLGDRQRSVGALGAHARRAVEGDRS